MPDTVRLQIDGPVARITLNRPEVRNAFNAEMIEELTAICAQLERREDVRVALLMGEGPSFSAGADAAWMRASLDFGEEENIADALRMSDMFAAINALPQAVIGRVHGAALGGGMGLIAVCDIVVSADDAVFGFTEVRLGIIPAVISRFVLPKIGSGWARALYLTGQRFGAEIAMRTGLVHWIAPVQELDKAIDERIADVLAGGPGATREAKRLIAGLDGLGDGALRDL
ncbi:MAG: enoyl-CoA hydratase-related protein, partial [Chloroflexota bacterium]